MGATDRYGALAEELATAIRSFSLPPASDPSLDRHRLVAYGSALGVPAASRSGLRRALATRLERDLRSRFETATAARRAVQTGRVSVIVREWDM